jgi:hypothetical protein
MKSRYYKPTGKAMIHVIDWLITRKTVRQAWDSFLETYAMQESDLTVEDGKITEVSYYPPFISDVDEIDTKVAKLPTMPTKASLGALLGVEQAKGVQTQGSGVIVLVVGDKGLADHEEIPLDVLNKKYGINYHIKDCPKCGLWLSYNEKKCHRCGEAVE